jgi:hypothetical protein
VLQNEYIEAVKSSHSNGGGTCVEVAMLPDGSVKVPDSGQERPVRS